MTDQNKNIEAAHQIIISLGLPRAQQNERSALSLLALLNLTPGKPWAEAENPLVGITPIMDWAREHYGKEYAPNTRETFRRQTMHQFCDAGVALYNPDKPDRPVNSPKAVYQVEPAALKLLRSFGSDQWHDNLTAYLAERETLVAKYAMEREQNRIPELSYELGRAMNQQEIYRKWVKGLVTMNALSFSFGVTTGWLFHTLWVLIQG